MKVFKNVFCVLFVVASALCATPCAEAFDFFTDRASFDAANPGLKLLDFEGIAPPGELAEPAPQPWAPNVVFSRLDGNTNFIAILGTGAFGIDTPSDVLFINLIANPMLVTFDSGTDAVGFDVSIYPGGLHAQVEAFDSDGGLLESADFDTEPEDIFSTFIGFSGVGEIRSIVITPEPQSTVFVDNFAFGSSVPEPALATVLMVSFAITLIRRTRTGATGSASASG